MSETISVLGSSRVFLMSFILFWSLFISENVLSQRIWQKGDMKITYNQNDKYIVFDFLFYDYDTTVYKVHSFLHLCDLKYSEDGIYYTDLISTQTNSQEIKDVMWMSIIKIKNSEQIVFSNKYKPEKSQLGSGDPNFMVGAKMINKKRRDDYYWKTSKNAYIKIKWKLPETCSPVLYFKLIGRWLVKETHAKGYKIEDIHKLDISRSSSNAMNITSSVLKSEISGNLQVTGVTDVINIKRAMQCKKINVYTVSGLEVKTFVAIDDVVNINLPKKQIYIVKSGEAHYKIAL